jgi:hypothetical protein
MKTRCILLVVAVGIGFGVLSYPTTKLMVWMGLGTETQIETYADLSPRKQSCITPEEFVPHTTVTVPSPYVLMALAAACALALSWRLSLWMKVAAVFLVLLVSHGASMASLLLVNLIYRL